MLIQMSVKLSVALLKALVLNPYFCQRKALCLTENPSIISDRTLRF